MKIVGCNGINSNGEASIDLLLEEIERRGFDTYDVQLPMRTWISARWGGKHDGELIADHSRDGDIIVGHSFGALRAWHASHIRRYAAIICIAPAMSRYAEWRDPQRVHCWASTDDWAIRIGARLLFHPFGAAGTDGFRQLEPYGRNYRVSAGHSDYFRPPLASLIADQVTHLAQRLAA